MSQEVPLHTLGSVRSELMTMMTYLERRLMDEIKNSGKKIELKIQELIESQQQGTLQTNVRQM